jgi:hypothetical protein
MDVETHVHADHVTGAWLLRERFGSRIALAAASAAEGADRLLCSEDRIEFGQRWLEVRATPGHTSGCVTYVDREHARPRRPCCSPRQASRGVANLAGGMLRWRVQRYAVEGGTE